MKKIYIPIFLLVSTLSQAQVGIGTTRPDKSAQVEITATDKGVLLPRVELVSLQDGTAPIDNPAEGLLIYNTKVDPANNLEKGFYVWDGTTWERFATKPELDAQSFWKQQGTASTQNPTPPISGAGGATTFSLLNATTNTTTSAEEIDIFQKGKVGIGYEAAYQIDFDLNPTQKQLEVGGDFRTSYFNDSNNVYYGFETNSNALPPMYGIRGNVLYSAGTKDLGAYNDMSKKFDGNIFLQSHDVLMFGFRKGMVEDPQGVLVSQFQQEPNAMIQQLIKVGNQYQSIDMRELEFSHNGFQVTDGVNPTTSDVTFGLDFNRGKFFIGRVRNNANIGYYFPNVKGTANQVLTFEGTNNELVWKNISAIVPATSVSNTIDNNALVTTVNGVASTAIDVITDSDLTLSGSSLTSTINGVDATVDLTPAIEAGQKTSSVVNGTTTAVTSAVTGKNTAYTVEVKDGAITDIKLAANAVTTAKINNAAVTSEKLTAGAGTNNRVGVANAAGVVTYTDVSTLVQTNQKTETVTQGNGIVVTPTVTGNVTDYNVKVAPGTTVNQVLTTQLVGAGPEVETQWKSFNELGISSTPKFFYMPSIVINTSSNATGLKRNLYAEYIAQFTGKEFIPDPVTGGAVGTTQSNKFISSPNAPAEIPHLPQATDLWYYVTDYDDTSLEIISIDEDGIMTYNVKGTGTDYSFVNIVFVVK